MEFSKEKESLDVVWMDFNFNVLLGKMFRILINFFMNGAKMNHEKFRILPNYFDSFEKNSEFLRLS